METTLPESLGGFNIDNGIFEFKVRDCRETFGMKGVFSENRDREVTFTFGGVLDMIWCCVTVRFGFDIEKRLIVIKNITQIRETPYSSGTHEIEIDIEIEPYRKIYSETGYNFNGMTVAVIEKVSKHFLTGERPIDITYAARDDKYVVSTEMLKQDIITLDRYATLNFYQYRKQKKKLCQ